MPQLNDERYYFESMTDALAATARFEADTEDFFEYRAMWIADGDQIAGVIVEVWSLEAGVETREGFVALADDEGVLYRIVQD